jgi:hypothetical protein
MSTVLERHSRGILLQAKGAFSYRVLSDQKVSEQSAGRLDLRREAAKDAQTKLAWGGSSGLSPLRANGSHNGQAGGWTSREVAKDVQGRVVKQL